MPPASSADSADANDEMEDIVLIDRQQSLQDVPASTRQAGQGLRGLWMRSTGFQPLQDLEGEGDTPVARPTGKELSPC
jgi:hypothetical protein